MASRNFALRACNDALTLARARARARSRAARLARAGSPLVLALSLLHCAPDFASLSSGGAGESGGALALGGRSNGGSSSVLGGGSGTAHGGDTAISGGTSGDGATGNGGSSSGEAGSGSSGGEAGGGSSNGGSSNGGSSNGGSSNGGGSNGGTSNGGSAGSGVAGTGGAPCVFTHPKARSFDGFDGGLSGTGFSNANTTSSITVLNNATASSKWDSTVGHSCPGSVRLTADFKGYSTDSTNSNSAAADLRFGTSDWTGATQMHMWVKVSPGSAPLQAIQVFVFSDTTAFRYASLYDDNAFRNGDWNEYVLTLSAGSSYNPKQVFRIGIQIILNAAGTAGNPSVPPVTTAWFDDVWTE